MNKKEAEKAVVKANAALTKAKDEFALTGKPVPEKLRKALKDAVSDLDYIEQRDAK